MVNFDFFTTEPEPMNKGIKYSDDYIGMRFGNLTVIGYPTKGRNGNRRAGAICECDCGEFEHVSCCGDLLRGKVTMCEKCRKKQFRERLHLWWQEHPRNHGVYYEFRNERLFHVWQGMKRRCGKACGYEDVSICDEWQDYRVFREWALSHGYDKDAPKGQCTIDRINPFGNYEPLNCRFVDLRTQAHNKRRDWLRMDEETREMMLRTALAE